MLSQVQAAEMGFLRRVHTMKLRDKVRSCEIREVLNVEPLLIQKPGSRLRWFDPVSRMSQERLAKQVLLAKATGKGPRGRPRTRRSDCICDLSWSVLAWSQQNFLSQQKFQQNFQQNFLLNQCEVFRVFLGLLPRGHPQKKSGYENESMHWFISVV